MAAKSTIGALLAAATSTICGPPLARAQEAGPSGLPGTDPTEIIAARRGLMTEMERLIVFVDEFTAGEDVSADVLRSAAASIAPMQAAFPYLFPPTTDLYEDSDAPATLALPILWNNLESFYSMSANAVGVAETLSQATTDDELMSAAIALRAACDACHALYTVPYTPSTVTSEDLQFDFDALFEEIEQQ